MDFMGGTMTMQHAQLPVDFQFNPFDYEFHADPKAVYRHLRDRSPLNYNEQLNLYALSRYDDVAEALSNDSVYSFCHSDTYEVLHPEHIQDLVGFFCSDAPRHNKQRQLSGRPFTPHKTQAAASRVARLGEYYLDSALDKARRNNCCVDFMNDIAGPISMAVIADFIGFPSEQRESIRHWIDLTVARDNGSAIVQPAALAASEQLLAYLYAFWAERERGVDQPETITDHMIRVVASGRLSKQHGISFLWALCFAGQEATAKMFGNAIYQASRHNLDYLLHKSPQLLDDFLLEVMRFDSPAQIIYRTALEDDYRHGALIKKGARVALMLGSAGVDERAFGIDAGEFKMGRTFTHDILTFGWGTHYCLGRHLGEMEVRVCVQQFFERVRTFRLDLDKATRVHTSTVHGFTSLPLQVIEFA